MQNGSSNFQKTYKDGLRDAANICRDVAKGSVPFKTSVWNPLTGISKHTNVNKKYVAKGAIRCARAIDDYISKDI